MGPQTRRGETDAISLRTYIGERLGSLEKLITERFDSLTREIDKVERGFARQIEELSKSTEQRFQQVNQYKEVTRKMSAEQHEQLENRLRIVEQVLANWQGRLIIIGGVWGIVAISISVLLNFFLSTVFN